MCPYCRVGAGKEHFKEPGHLTALSCFLSRAKRGGFLDWGWDLTSIYKNTYLYLLFSPPDYTDTWMHPRRNILTSPQGSLYKPKSNAENKQLMRNSKLALRIFLMVPLPKSKTYCRTPKLRSKAIYYSPVLKPPDLSECKAAACTEP